MEYSEFKNFLLNGINKKDKSSVKLINNNKVLIQSYFNENNLNYVADFIDSLYSPILNEKKKFKVIEDILKNPSMSFVLAEFRKSNILIKICDEGSNKKAIEWLLSMNMDLCVQDENGRTALMCAVHHWNLESIVDKFLEAKGKHLDLADNDGNTALFHACQSTIMFKKLINSNLFDYNHINNDHENILLYGAKYDALRSFDTLMNLPNIDINIVNNVGKNLATILVENARYAELKILYQKKHFNVNYKNKFGETLVSIFFRKYQQQIEEVFGKIYETEFNYYKVKNFAQTLKTLIDIGCDFNSPIDGDGNTPVMILMIMEDYVSLKYVLDNCSYLDLSIKNKYGVDATYLSLFIKKSVFDSVDYNKLKGANSISYKSLKHALMNGRGFNFNAMDSNNNNMVICGLAHNDPMTVNYIDNISPKLLLEKNNKNENAIIVATKLGRDVELSKILEKFSGDNNDKEKYVRVNAQDNSGNTALHYAVLIRNKYVINLLMNHQADLNLKNNEGKSPLDLSKEIEESTAITDLLLHPRSSSEMRQMLMAIKGKSTDEKVDDYIKNYRIVAFQQEYEDLCRNENISCYVPSPYNSTVEQWMMEVLYPSAVSQIYVFNPFNTSPKNLVKDIKNAGKTMVTNKY